MSKLCYLLSKTGLKQSLSLQKSYGRVEDIYMTTNRQTYSLNRFRKTCNHEEHKGNFLTIGELMAGQMLGESRPFASNQRLTSLLLPPSYQAHDKHMYPNIQRIRQ